MNPGERTNSKTLEPTSIRSKMLWWGGLLTLISWWRATVCRPPRSERLLEFVVLRNGW